MNGILGIVSEYNPFHNGHLHHLELSKQLTNTDFTVAVMSGNFVQRGDTSIVDKWTKAQKALTRGIKLAKENGADLVIELPTVYAISSAENFADGAVKILNSLGVVDYISFGSEIGEISPLNDVASILYREPKEFQALILAQLKSGLSYPKAREIALSQFFGNSKKYTEVLSNPNNILGVEYLKALKRHRSHIKPLTIKRDYSDYNSTNVKNGIATHDGCAIAYVTNPELFKTKPVFAKINYYDKIGTGVLCMNFDRKANATACVSMNIKKFKKLYFKCLKQCK